MDNKVGFIIEDGVEILPSPLLRVDRPYRYGRVEGLPDEELASPEELEQQVIKEELGAILVLPQRKQQVSYSPAWDGSHEIGFDAFGTVDFDKYSPDFDKARYKADKLREQLRDKMNMFSMMSEKIPSKAKYGLLRLVKEGHLDIGEIADVKMYFLAELYLRILRINREIIELRKASAKRKQKAHQAWLDSLG